MTKFESGPFFQNDLCQASLKSLKSYWTDEQWAIRKDASPSSLSSDQGHIIFMLSVILSCHPPKSYNLVKLSENENFNNKNVYVNGKIYTSQA
jgi:hypothetical protein